MSKNRKSQGFLQKKGINISAKVYLIDAMGSIAFGLFSSLLIGTIFKTIGQQLNIDWLIEISTYTTQAQGAAMAVAVATALKAPPLVIFSSATVGVAGNALGGPLGVFIASIISIELGKLVSKETKIDIIVTPTVTILSGCLVAHYVGPIVSEIMYAFGDVINTATQMQPFLMGIIVSVVIGIVLTLPISSAALCIMLGISGLAGGAAVAGCSAQMVGFAVASYKENKLSGLISQGIGTSMLQVPNIVRKPAIWLTPIITSAITGPMATMIFKLTISSEFSVTAGMGTCGLVGPIGIISSMGAIPKVWTATIIICFVAPALISYALDSFFRKIGIVKFGDQKLDL